jgi:hypothetical protein
MPKQKTVIAVALGQLLSLCITGTSSASSALWRHHAVSIPFTQNFCNYLLLAIVYTLISFKNTNPDLGPKSKISWQCKVNLVLKKKKKLRVILLTLFFCMTITVLGFSFADVQGK